MDTTRGDDRARTAGAGEERAASVRLVAVSFATLLLELSFIRYVNSTVEVIAYFNNFVLVAAFLGLGIGSLLPASTRLLQSLPLVLALAVTTMAYLDRFGVRADFSEDVYATGIMASMLPLGLVVGIVFVLSVAIFVPLGNQLGLWLERHPRRLLGYGWDLTGSLLGVAGFATLSALQTPPWVWFACGGAAVLVLYETAGKRALAAVGLAAAAALSAVPTPGTWSPYYKVQLAPFQLEGQPYGYAVLVDRLRIQDAFLFGETLARSRSSGWIDYYRVPYVLTRPRSVLVLGGGSGNDATVALTFGAERVDVVEIDPVILSLGRDVHPHRPYLDPRVRTFNDDARAFLRGAHGPYDLVVMNALDSHRQLPGLSTLRLESYVYTVESFRDVRRQMGPGSTLVVQLTTSRDWMGDRLYWSLAEAFDGREPQLYWTPRGPHPVHSVAFVQSAGPLTVAPPVEPIPPADVAAFKASRSHIDLATDDWPHLYLAGRAVPRIYQVVLAAAVLGSALVVFLLARPVGVATTLHFMLLGAGFMLLETRSITRTALLFGATWVVNAVVIGFILLCVAVANAAVLKGVAPRPAVTFALLAATLLLGFFVPIHFALALPFAARVVVGGLWVALPVVFASLMFSRSYAGTPRAAAAFGANLLGVVVGAVLEYGSMVTGLDALYLVALALYLGAAVLAPRVST